MFLQQLDGIINPGHTAGVVLIKHLKSKKYFLNNVNDVQTYLMRLRRYVTGGDYTSRAFQEFQSLAQGSVSEDWEFLYSTNPNEPLPADVMHSWTYVYSNTANDAVVNNRADLAIFRVEHKNTTFPVYVVDKSCAKKASIVRKAISQLRKYAHAGERAWYASYVCKDPNLFQRAWDHYDCSLYNLAGKSMHDVRYEPIPYDKDIYATHLANAQALNLAALKEWKQSLMAIA